MGLRHWIFACFAFAVFSAGTPSTLAPGPSGTITLTVGAGGNSPPTGYTLFSVLGRALHHLIPIGEMAWHFHMASALMSAVAFVFLLLAGEFALKLWSSPAHRPLTRGEFLLLGTGILSALLGSEAIARVTYYSDRYSTSAAVVCALIAFWLRLQWQLARGEDHQRLTKTWWALILTATLTLHTHLTMIPAAGLLVLTAWWSLKAERWTKSVVVGGGIAVLLGLLPWLYLPLNASLDPLFNWGNVDSFSKFKFYVTRTEYGDLPKVPHWSYHLQQLGRDLELFVQQFHWLHLVFGVAGLAGIAFKRSFVAAGGVLLLFLTGFLMPLVWPWPVSHPNPDYLANIHDLLVKYLSPAYFVFAGMVGFGVVAFFRKMAETSQFSRGFAVAKSLTLGIFVVLMITGWRSHNKAAFAMTDEFSRNAEVLIPEGGVVLTSFDSCFSALSYSQLFQKKFLNRPVLHTELMFRSWYLRTIEKLYPQLYSSHQSFFDDLKATAENIENGNLDLVDKAFQLRSQLLRSLSESYSEEMYYCPSPYGSGERVWTRRGFRVEPMVYFFRLHRKSHELRRLDIQKFTYVKHLEQAQKGDEWSRVLLKKTAQTLQLRSEVYRLLEPEHAAELIKISDQLLEGAR